MKYALGCKLVQFEPMTFEEFIKKSKDQSVHYTIDGKSEGYKVVYEDGYESWSPKETFERFYFPLSDPEGSKIMLDDITKMLVVNDISKKDEKTTEMKATTLTGFVQYATSSCADPKNYSREIGGTLCLKTISDPIWKAFGFALQWAKYGLKGNIK